MFGLLMAAALFSCAAEAQQPAPAFPRYNAEDVAKTKWEEFTELLATKDKAAILKRFSTIKALDTFLKAESYIPPTEYRLSSDQYFAGWTNDIWRQKRNGIEIRYEKSLVADSERFLFSVRQQLNEQALKQMGEAYLIEILGDRGVDRLGFRLGTQEPEWKWFQDLLETRNAEDVLMRFSDSLEVLDRWLKRQKYCPLAEYKEAHKRGKNNYDMYVGETDQILSEANDRFLQTIRQQALYRATANEAVDEFVADPDYFVGDFTENIYATLHRARYGMLDVAEFPYEKRWAVFVSEFRRRYGMSPLRWYLTNAAPSIRLEQILNVVRGVSESGMSGRIQGLACITSQHSALSTNLAMMDKRDLRLELEQYCGQVSAFLGGRVRESVGQTHSVAGYNIGIVDRICYAREGDNLKHHQIEQIAALYNDMAPSQNWPLLAEGKIELKCVDDELQKRSASLNKLLLNLNPTSVQAIPYAAMAAIYKPLPPCYRARITAMCKSTPGSTLGEVLMVLNAATSTNETPAWKSRYYGALASDEAEAVLAAYLVAAACVERQAEAARLVADPYTVTENGVIVASPLCEGIGIRSKEEDFKQVFQDTVGQELGAYLDTVGKLDWVDRNWALIQAAGLHSEDIKAGVNSAAVAGTIFSRGEKGESKRLMLHLVLWQQLGEISASPAEEGIRGMYVRTDQKFMGLLPETMVESYKQDGLTKYLRDRKLTETEPVIDLLFSRQRVAAAKASLAFAFGLPAGAEQKGLAAVVVSRLSAEELKAVGDTPFREETLRDYLTAAGSIKPAGSKQSNAAN